MNDSLIALLIAFVLDLYLGDPVYPFHPVRLIGHLIQKLEWLLEKLRLFHKIGGVLLLVCTQLAVIGIYLLLNRLIADYSLLLATFIIYSTISIQDLVMHGKAVMIALEADNLEQARNAVQMMIGRDSKTLDIHGVARAAVESLAENFVDSFLAPLFWLTIGVIISDKAGIYPLMGGCVFILIYRVSNTLDSMAGYKNERYNKFGWASAKLDDVLNYIPARLGIPVIALSAFFCRLDGNKAFIIGWKDRLKHSSPNAGHAEAAVAGALHVRLNGPGIYPHGKVDKPWLGEGTELVTARHLKQASYLVLTAAFIFITLCSITIAVV